MRYEPPIPVRFTADVDQRLGEISARSKLKKAELVRIATLEFLEKVEKTGVIEQRIVISAKGEEGGTVSKRRPQAGKKKVLGTAGSAPYSITKIGPTMLNEKAK